MNYVITIGRQLGSGGKLTGQRLAQRLDIPCYDKELIQIAAKESGLCKELFERADETGRFTFAADYFYLAGNNPYFGAEALFKIQSDVLRELAEKSSCIFIGRCADYILREHPRCLRVFVAAAMPDRIRRVATELNISDKKAMAQIERIDKKRAEYYHFFSDKTWGMAASYDLCLNSSTIGIDEIASVIEDAARRKFHI
ncbi:MAG: cytidylate kinase-like family protein [Tannerellaceae bacterium]|jgi:cytidylate kinase|nr:cytidylate kinase-like family protein [Tannerellaceae bacterium]